MLSSPSQAGASYRSPGAMRDKASCCRRLMMLSRNNTSRLVMKNSCMQVVNSTPSLKSKTQRVYLLLSVRVRTSFLSSLAT